MPVQSMAGRGWEGVGDKGWGGGGGQGSFKWLGKGG